MNSITIHEFDVLTSVLPGMAIPVGLHTVPVNVHAWLENQCLQISEQGEAAWLRLTQRHGRRVVQVTSFVGVIRAPDGFQIEVLPKVGKVIGGGTVEARRLLIDMLCCLQNFRHVQTESARLLAARMPLLEVFVAEFLRAVQHVVKRGLRSDYRQRQGNLSALRGKLLVASHLQQNLCRADRFYTAHDDFSIDRPENRVLRAGLRRVLAMSASQANQQLARELDFVFADVPASADPKTDVQRMRLDRAMVHYGEALAWARLILEEQSPLTGQGQHSATSLLFPMESLFEAFVAKHLAQQLAPSLTLTTQARGQHLVRHVGRDWFRLQPDLLIRHAERPLLVLDTKWKLLDRKSSNGSDKYGLSQGDFYQLLAYGKGYLGGQGDIVLIYPRTDAFDAALPVFDFPHSDGLRLWVVPFCLQRRRLLISSEMLVAGLGSWWRYI